MENEQLRLETNTYNYSLVIYSSWTNTSSTDEGTKQMDSLLHCNLQNHPRRAPSILPEWLDCAREKTGGITRNKVFGEKGEQYRQCYTQAKTW